LTNARHKAPGKEQLRAVIDLLLQYPESGRLTSKKQPETRRSLSPPLSDEGYQTSINRALRAYVLGQEKKRRQSHRA
jgi:hypothetical protein